MSTEVTINNFKKEVIESPVPVLLDFWAPWCGPCRMVSPILDELSSDVADNAKICKINVDKEIELAQAFGVSSIPTLVVFDNGKPKGKVVGLRNKDDLRQLLGV